MLEKYKYEESIKGVNKIINMIPGSLVYRGVKKEQFTLQRIFFNSKSYKSDFYSSCRGQFENDIKNAPDDIIQWINVTGLNNIEEIRDVGKCFNINSIVLEQVLDVSKQSLYKVTEEYVFNSLQMIYLKNGIITNEAVSIYFIGNTLITFQEREGDVFESIRSRVENDEGNIRNENSFYSYFCILDALVDHYINVLEKIKNDVEKMELGLMENQILDNKELHLIRKEILIIRLNSAPMEKLVQELVLMNNAALVEQKKYFESLAQNIRHAMFEGITLKESVDNLYENYMMTNANDMNQVMTILTIFSAIFIPLSFAAGVFGMNFDIIPGLNNPVGFIYFLVGCGLTSLVMLSMFKYKKWF